MGGTTEVDRRRKQIEKPNPQTGTSPFKWFATEFFLPGYNQVFGSVVLAEDEETAQQIVNTFVGKYRRERV